MSWNIKTPGDYINGPLTVAGVANFNSNIGMSATPSAWGPGFRAIEFPFGTSFFVNSFVPNPNIGANFYIDAAVKNIYKSNGAATSYSQYNGAHSWFCAAAGIAGNEVTDFASARMTLNTTGLGLGISPSAKLHALVAPPAAGSDGLRIGDGTRINQFAITGSSYSYKGVGALQPFIYGSGGPLNILADNDEIKLITGTGFQTRLNATGAVALHGGNTAANGIGIAFPAAQSASTDANTLDDYEEGSFTPTVVGTATYTVQVGRYVKIGNRVFVQIRLIIATIGTGENWRISGLPFASTNNAIAPISIGYFANLAIVANFLSGYVNTGYAHIVLAATTTASANITNGAPVLGNSSDLSISFHYEV